MEKQPAATVFNLCTSRTARGKGYATLLLKRAVEIALSQKCRLLVGNIRLGTEASEKLLGMYRRFGAEESEEGRAYGGGGSSGREGGGAQEVSCRMRVDLLGDGFRASRYWEQEWGEYEVVKKFFSGRAPEACEEVEEGKGEGG